MSITLIVLFIVLVVTFVLIWDICYRMGVGIWVSNLALWRSIKLRRLSLERIELEHTPYTELKQLGTLDLNNLFFGVVGLFLLPIVFRDPIAVLVVFIFIFGVTLPSFFSMYILSTIPWLPPDVYELMEDTKISYLGTADNLDYPHITPNTYVFDGRRIYVPTSRDSKKIRNIKENKMVALLVDKRDVDNMYENKAVMFMGEAKVYRHFISPIYAFRLYRMYFRYKRKFPQYVAEYTEKKKDLPKAWKMTAFARVLIEVEPRKVIYWTGIRHIRVPV